MIKFKAVVFDLDGTLLDTIDDLVLAMNEIMVKNRLPSLNREQVRLMIGNGAREFMRMAIPKPLRSDEYIDELLLQYRDADSHKNAVMTKPFEGVFQLLQFLKENNVKTAVLSNKPDEATQAVIARYFKPKSFDLIMGHKKGFQEKPHPASLEYVMQTLNSDRESTLMVGDGDADCLVSKNAKVTYAAALWGYRTKSELTAVGAKNFFYTPLELQQAIKDNKF